MNPEKQVSAYDSKFQKKWYELCDEAERAQIGQASYRAFRAVNVFCPFLWLALLLLSYVFPIGLLPMASVLAVWAVLEVTYILECIRLSRRKAGCDGHRAAGRRRPMLCCLQIEPARLSAGRLCGMLVSFSEHWRTGPFEAVSAGRRTHVQDD